MAAVDIADLAHKKDDPLVLALDQLRLMISLDDGAADGDWPDAVWHALSLIEKGVRRHLESTRAGGQSAPEIDQRPSLSRHKEELCRLYRDLREQVLALKWEARRTAQALDPNTQAYRHPVASSKRLRIVSGLRERLARIVADLEKALGAENALVLESVTTDIGVGD